MLVTALVGFLVAFRLLDSSYRRVFAGSVLGGIGLWHPASPLSAIGCTWSPVDLKLVIFQNFSLEHPQATVNGPESEPPAQKIAKAGVTVLQVLASIFAMTAIKDDVQAARDFISVVKEIAGTEPEDDD